MRFHAFRKLLAVLAIALCAAIVVCFLPTDPYQRWQLLKGTIHARSQWVYERIHFDPTPVDVVFVGSSRIGAGIDAPRIQQALRKGGLSDINVVNFSLPEQGRNLNSVVVRELLKEKKPRLIVIGVQDKPSRFGHPAYKYLAPASMLVNPEYAGNANYPSDLIYLPYRQMVLFAANLFPEMMGYTKHFDPAGYAGPTIDTTRAIELADGETLQQDRPAPLSELKRGVAKLERGNVPAILSRSLADVEFGDERLYIRDIAAAARAAGSKVAFVALPYYTGPTTLQEERLYAGIGPVWNAGFVRDEAHLYRDYAHLSGEGADQVSDWLVPKIATLVR